MTSGTAPIDANFVLEMFPTRMRASLNADIDHYEGFFEQVVFDHPRAESDHGKLQRQVPRPDGSAMGQARRPVYRKVPPSMVRLREGTVATSFRPTSVRFGGEKR
jgi:hypothetical protein